MNRVSSPSFPKTVCGVVFQGAATHGCQFSFACDGSMRHTLETDAWDRARQVAERALSGVVLADIGSATHFHTTAVQPSWGPQMLRVAQVGLHVFYRLNPHAPAVRPMETERAVFVNLPMGPVANVRMATAVLQKTADATVAATGLGSGPAEATPAEPAISQGRAADTGSLGKAPRRARGQAPDAGLHLASLKLPGQPAVGSKGKVVGWRKMPTRSSPGSS